jgi:hypothetical protein
MSNSPHSELMTRVQVWLERDRQWSRHCRITHARLQMSLANKRPDGDADFWLWSAVLEANGAHNE